MKKFFVFLNSFEIFVWLLFIVDCVVLRICGVLKFFLKVHCDHSSECGSMLFGIAVNPVDRFEFCVCGRDEFVRIFDERKMKQEAICPGNYFSFYSNDIFDSRGDVGNRDGALKKIIPFRMSSSSSGKFYVTSVDYSYDGMNIVASYNDDDIYMFESHSQRNHEIGRYFGHRNSTTGSLIVYFESLSKKILFICFVFAFFLKSCE
jgi:WD40 repeat protein